MNIITFDQFAAVELRAGTIIRAEAFPEARKPAYKLWADFGPESGVKQSSASASAKASARPLPRPRRSPKGEGGQITVHYTPESLIGRQIVGCLNLGSRKIGPFTSEFLCTGFPDAEGAVVLISPDKPVPNGAKLF